MHHNAKVIIQVAGGGAGEGGLQFWQVLLL